MQKKTRNSTATSNQPTISPLFG